MIGECKIDKSNEATRKAGQSALPISYCPNTDRDPSYPMVEGWKGGGGEKKKKLFPVRIAE